MTRNHCATYVDNKGLLLIFNWKDFKLIDR